LAAVSDVIGAMRIDGDGRDDDDDVDERTDEPRFRLDGSSGVGGAMASP
jgi:hypothetical protein